MFSRAEVRIPTAGEPDLAAWLFVPKCEVRRRATSMTNGDLGSKRCSLGQIARASADARFAARCSLGAPVMTGANTSTRANVGSRRHRSWPSTGSKPACVLPGPPLRLCSTLIQSEDNHDNLNCSLNFVGPAKVRRRILGAPLAPEWSHLCGALRRDGGSLRPTTAGQSLG